MECQIRIKSPTYPLSSDLIITHDVNQTILELKTKIREALANDSLTETAQKLIYAGHVLADDNTLSQLNVPSSATFHLVTAPSIKPLPQADSDPAPSTEIKHAAQSIAPSLATGERSTSPLVHVTEPPAPDETSQRLNRSASQAAVTTATDLPDPEPVQDTTMPITEDLHMYPGLDAHTTSVANPLRQRDFAERTNISYDLHYIDGYPYLIKAAGRTLRPSRRMRTSGIAQSPARAFTTTSNRSQQTTAGTMRQAAATTTRRVDLPATVAIPVRTADGRRALILSPEGVRAMAAQGVNVDVSRRDSPFGITSATFRQFMRTGVPHAWLALKLSFLVAMLGTNSSWYRFTILNLLAIGIFFWQSGLLRNIMVWGRPPGHPTVSTQAGSQLPEPGQGPDSVALADSATQNDPIVPAETPLLHNFGRAFLASIVPSTSSAAMVPPPAPVPRGLAGRPANNTSVQLPDSLLTDQGNATADIADQAGPLTGGDRGAEAVRGGERETESVEGPRLVASVDASDSASDSSQRRSTTSADENGNAPPLQGDW